MVVSSDAAVAEVSVVELSSVAVAGVAVEFCHGAPPVLDGEGQPVDPVSPGTPLQSLHPVNVVFAVPQGGRVASLGVEVSVDEAVKSDVVSQVNEELPVVVVLLLRCSWVVVLCSPSREEVLFPVSVSVEVEEATKLWLFVGMTTVRLVVTVDHDFDPEIGHPEGQGCPEHQLSEHQEVFQLFEGPKPELGVKSPVSVPLDESLVSVVDVPSGTRIVKTDATVVTLEISVEEDVFELSTPADVCPSDGSVFTVVMARSEADIVNEELLLPVLAVADNEAVESSHALEVLAVLHPGPVLLHGAPYSQHTSVVS
jgi:hypothetical protein